MTFEEKYNHIRDVFKKRHEKLIKEQSDAYDEYEALIETEIDSESLKLAKDKWLAAYKKMAVEGLKVGLLDLISEDTLIAELQDACDIWCQSEDGDVWCSVRQAVKAWGILALYSVSGNEDNYFGNDLPDKDPNNMRPFWTAPTFSMLYNVDGKLTDDARINHDKIQWQSPVKGEDFMAVVSDQW